MRVLVACEFSGAVRRAFRALGHHAYSCDLLPSEDGSPHHIIPMVDPSRSSSIGSVPLMVISLPAPPWGGGFKRQGVSA